MAKIVYGLNQSLDGYVDHDKFGPSPKLFRHFIELAGQVGGSVYGTTMYRIMRYWDDDQPEWEDAEREYAAAWRSTQSGSPRARSRPMTSGATPPSSQTTSRASSAG